MRKVLGVVGATLLLAGPTFAADLLKAPAMPLGPIYNWTGFYIGGNVGGVEQSDSGTSNFFSANSPAIQTNNPQSNSLTSTSIIGGVQAGYNWQINQWVIGVEGDWDWTKTKASFCRQTDVFSLPCSDNGFGFLTIGSGTDWIATARGRLGFAWDRFLVYGTGGAAWGKVNTSINANCLVDGCGFSVARLNATANFSDTKTGWVAGAGFETMLTPNWIARVEYLHVDLGTISNVLNLVGTVGPQSASWSRTVTFDEVRGGLSYKF